jgi:hypothetical protein
MLRFQPVPFVPFVFAAALFGGLAACSSSSSSAPAPVAASPADDGGAASNEGGGAFTHDLVYTMSLTVPPATELHQCQFVQLPAGSPVNITGFAHQYTPGSHHFLVYQTDLTAIPADLTGQYDCTYGGEPIMKHAKSIIYGAQTPTGAFPFPAGVGVTVPASTVLIMNTHYLNAGSTELATTVQVGLDTTTPDKVQTQGGFFIFYDPFIDVPAHATASSGGRCPVPADVTIINAFTHYHYRGTQMRVWLDPSPTVEAPSVFFSTDDWQHPANFAGPVTWPKGSVVRFQCDYDNTDPAEVFQGPNAKTSEMCVFAGLYYPKQSDVFEGCDQYSVSGFGAKSCLDTVSCLGACPASDAPVHTETTVEVGPCWEHCVAAACDGAMDRVFPLFDCAAQQCATECAQAGATCTSCATSKCAAQVGTCATYACPK